jgi:hypothetical protein
MKRPRSKKKKKKKTRDEKDKGDKNDTAWCALIGPRVHMVLRNDKIIILAQLSHNLITYWV